MHEGVGKGWAGCNVQKHTLWDNKKASNGA